MNAPLKEEVGFTVSCQDYLFYLEGLPSAKINDILLSPTGKRAIVGNLYNEKVQGLMLETEKPVPGDIFKIDAAGIRIPLGQFLFGRTISPLGVPLDGKQVLPLDGPKLEIETAALGIEHRELITERLETGFALVDTLLPLGKGQRELILGDARSGKSAFIIDTIAAQKGKNVICIYAAIGKSEIETKRVGMIIDAVGANQYTIVVAATGSSPAPLIMICPEVALSIAEYFRKRGRDVLVILDDLGVHAKFLREIGLLGRMIPGRESYPGGIFYAHSHLMERAGKFNQAAGSGTITLLPIIETDLENMTNLIPTNLMSQTDGHLLFSSSLSSQGQYPAIDWDRSVTRVGRQTLNALHKALSYKLRLVLAEYKELESLSRFEGELAAQTQTTIKQGQIITEFLRQENNDPIDTETQVILLSLIFSKFFDDKNLNFAKEKKKNLVEVIKKSRDLKDAYEQGRNGTLEDFIAKINNNRDELERV